MTDGAGACSFFQPPGRKWSVGTRGPRDGVAGQDKRGARPATLRPCQGSASQAGDVMKREQDYEAAGGCLRRRLACVAGGLLEEQIWCARHGSLALEEIQCPPGESVAAAQPVCRGAPGRASPGGRSCRGCC